MSSPISQFFISSFLALAIATMPTGIDNKIAQLVESKSPLISYPTNLTQGIVPKPIHSHNDYWRQVPLLTALSFGVTSIEADVWFIDGELFVGHEPAALTPTRTFESLYVKPLLSLITAQNPKTRFTTNQTTPNGVWDTASSVPVQLLVDMKTDGDTTLPAVVRALQPLRAAGFLSTVHPGASTITLAPVLVVGTGNTPLAGIQALSPRDVFFDAPLTALNDTFTPLISPLASTDWATAIGWNGIGEFPDDQRETLVRLVNDAHSRNIRSRFWDTPGWPIAARNAIWQAVLNAGSDWLNADDVEAASKF